MGGEDWEARSEQVCGRLDLPPVPTTPLGSLWAVTMVKDEADIIERTLRHLFAQGVDGILVSDNGSTDETREVLERLAVEYPVFVADDREPAYYQDVKMTLLSDWAHEAGAEWIIPFDADELWFAPAGTLKEWLMAQPADVVYADLYNLFPSRLPAGWALDRTPHPYPKIAFRALKGARLGMGNHSVDRVGARARGLSIVHIPWRSYEQFSRKVRNGAAALALTELDLSIGSHWREAGALPEDVLRAVWDDLTDGLGHPSLGWTPRGWLVPADVTSWTTFDPQGLLRVPSRGDEGKSPLTVVYGRPQGAGWDPITLMARLAATLLEAEYREIRVDKPLSKATAASGLLPRRRGGRDCLVIAAQPVHLAMMLDRHYWLHGYGTTVGWVIDSFLDDRIPRLARGRGHFDQLFVTDGELVGDWERKTRTPTDWLPWGADVLDMGPLRLHRPIDLQRVGRQPAQWDDDDENQRAAAEVGLRYRGRPEFGGTPPRSQEILVDALSRSKFALAFSNRHSPAAYTHPTREYLTGRWTTALAAGASVVGIAPRCMATDSLLWEGALLELDSVDRESGLPQVARAVADWAPQRAVHNRLEALRRLDWRWRFKMLAGALGLRAPLLDAELLALEDKEKELAAISPWRSAR